MTETRFNPTQKFRGSKNDKRRSEAFFKGQLDTNVNRALPQKQWKSKKERERERGTEREGQRERETERERERQRERVTERER